MTLDQLRTFCAVARLQSFSRAGQSLYLTQPAISTQIRALENHYHVKLFERTGRGIRLTEAGEILLASAQEILRLVEETQQSLDDLEALHRGRLSVEASLVAGVYLLPQILSKFKQTYPRTDLKLRIEHTHSIHEHVLTNAIDLGIVGEGAPVDGSLVEIIPFFSDELVVITSPHHAWAERNKIMPAELAQQPFIMFGPGSATGDMITKKLEDRGIHLQVAMELGNTELIKKAVEADLGVGLISRCAVLKEANASWLNTLQMSGLTIRREYSLIWRKGKHLPKAMEIFVQYFMNNSGRFKQPRGHK